MLRIITRFNCLAAVIVGLAGLTLATSCTSLEESLGALFSSPSTELIAEPSTDPGADVSPDPLQDLTRRCDLDEASACYTLANMYYHGQGTDANLQSAVDLLQKSCDLELTAACNTLGKLYYEGKGVKRDLAAAQALYHKSCMIDSGEACYILGEMYYNNKDTELSLNTAASLFYTSCAREYGDGCSRIGMMMYKGEGIERDVDTAIQMLQMGCELKSTIACNNLASISANKQALAESHISHPQVLSPASTRQSTTNDALQECNQHNTKACVTLAMDYYHGTGGVKRDLSLTHQLLQKGCDLNHGPSCSMLGMLYNDGEGVEHNAALAKNFLSKGCSLGVGLACDKIGMLYYRAHQDTDSTKAMLRRALPYFQQGCDLNVGNSCFRLGRTYYHFGQVVAQDAAARDKYLKKACDLDNRLACRFLGVLNLYGDDNTNTPQNLAQAKVLLEKACNLKEGAACSYLASAYSEEEDAQAAATGIPVDHNKRFRRNRMLLTKACEFEDGLSCYMLGDGYETVDHDLVQAKKAYQTGCDLRDEESCKALEKLGVQIKRLTDDEANQRKQQLAATKQQAKQLESDLEAIRTLVLESTTPNGH